MNTMIADPVFTLPWTPESLAHAYEHFQIKDENSICPCSRLTARVFDGLCFACHVALFKKLERNPCPKLP